MVLKRAGKIFFRKLFELGQILGVDVLPRYFYSEIPDIHYLKRTTEWKSPYSMLGVDGFDSNKQAEFLKRCCQDKLDFLSTGQIHSNACKANQGDGYGEIEADFLYCFIQSIKPKKIIQIGCGVSTAVMVSAFENCAYRPEIVCVDPYPSKFLKELDQKKVIKLIPEKVELLPVEMIADLGRGGFLFIDSTHTLRPGGDVPRLILEVLPRLKPGNWVHFHDIYFPYDYTRGILAEDLFFPHESVLLHAFLTNNTKFTVALSMSFLHYSDPSALKTYLPNYMPSGNSFGLQLSPGHFPSSIYLQVKEAR